MDSRDIAKFEVDHIIRVCVVCTVIEFQHQHLTKEFSKSQAILLQHRWTEWVPIA